MSMPPLPSPVKAVTNIVCAGPPMAAADVVVDTRLNGLGAS